MSALTGLYRHLASIGPLKSAMQALGWSNLAKKLQTAFMLLKLFCCASENISATFRALLESNLTIPGTKLLGSKSFGILINYLLNHFDRLRCLPHAIS
jgi:hypothetical protein